MIPPALSQFNLLRLLRLWGGRIRGLLGLFRVAADSWSANHATTMAAALAYYTILSLAPLLVVVVAIAGRVYGVSAAESEMLEQFEVVAGHAVAEAIRGLIATTTQPGSSLVASLVSLAVTTWAASGVFDQLQSSLNTIWQVDPEHHRSWSMIIQRRLIAFFLVIGVGFTLLFLIALSTAFTAFELFVENHLGNLPPPPSMFGFPSFQSVVIYFIMVPLFAIMYRNLPQTSVYWQDVWAGSFLTALLFMLSRSLIGLYLQYSRWVPAYGAAGSLVVLLIWFYFAAGILFYGAEFCKAYADRFGSRSGRDVT